MGPSPRRKGVRELGIPVPRQMKRLPFDERTGFHVPWFVAWMEQANGTMAPDFRVIREAGREDAYQHGLCWVCGKPLGDMRAWAIGPMCGINRVTSEPASHGACARYAVKVCPFMITPARKRNYKALPDDLHEPDGLHVPGNPGAYLLWYSRTCEQLIRLADGGFLFGLPEPEKTEWYARGAIIDEKEAFEPFTNGARRLIEIVAAEQDPVAVIEFSGAFKRAIDTCFPRQGSNLTADLRATLGNT